MLRQSPFCWFLLRDTVVRAVGLGQALQQAPALLTGSDTFEHGLSGCLSYLLCSLQHFLCLLVMLQSVYQGFQHCFLHQRPSNSIKTRQTYHEADFNTAGAKSCCMP